jgi:hypothetical protein
LKIFYIVIRVPVPQIITILALHPSFGSPFSFFLSRFYFVKAILKYPLQVLIKFKMLLMVSRLFVFALITTISATCRGQAPYPPVNPSPANLSGASTVNPNLCATVSDPNGGALQVRYFGRERMASNSNKFTIVFLPDTQYYTEEPQGNHGGNSAMFNSQTAWIANNRAAKNIVYAGHLGDCVQNGDDPPGSNNEIEWQRAQPAMATLENPALTGMPQGIPFGVCVGNHDETPNGDATGTTTYYNQYFGVNHFNGRYYYGGHYGSNNDNHFEFFTASGVNFMVISLKYDQTENFSVAGGPLDWAAGLVQTYTNRKVIVMTHYVMNEDMTFSVQGQAIYNKLKVYPNFGLLIGGHVYTTDGEAKRTDVYNGNTVHTMLSDYQGRTGGGNGLLRLLEFDPDLNKISVKTYSPYTNTYETDADSQFDLSFNMLPGLGQVNNVASGSNTCYNWNNLSFNSDYEWDMELYDGQNVAIGPRWGFTTPAGASLPVTLVNFSAGIINKKVRLDWRTANELNNLRFEIERSTDRVNFDKLGEVAGKGNTGYQQLYAFYDEQPLPGRAFYRLKQKDLDGHFNYSNVESVVHDVDGKFAAWPNPVSGSGIIQIRMQNEIRGVVKIIVTDIAGDQVYAGTKNNPPNNFRIMPGLSAGTYIIALISESIKAMQKIIVVNK